jgi:hypothetical protein
MAATLSARDAALRDALKLLLAAVPTWSRRSIVECQSHVDKIIDDFFNCGFYEGIVDLSVRCRHVDSDIYIYIDREIHAYVHTYIDIPAYRYIDR